MRTLRNLTVGALLAATAVATAVAGEERIETIVVTAKPSRLALAEAEKVKPETTVEIVSPMPTDMPEAEVHYHISKIGSEADTADKAAS